MSRTVDFRRCLAVSTVVTVLVSATAATPAVQAQDPVQVPATAERREHVVRKGDTLWDLAKTYYGNPFLWKVIYDANKPVVENPHWIYPIERLIIPGLDASASRPLGNPVPPSIAIEVIPMVEPADTPATVLTTVDMRRPLVAPLEHMTAPWLLGTPVASVLGRIVRVSDPSATDDLIPQQLYPNARVVLGELRGTPMRVGDSIQIVRVGRRLGTYGFVVEPLGIMRVDSLGTAIATAHMLRQFGPAKVGDYVMALPHAPMIGWELQPVSGGAEGKVLEFLDPAEIHGPGDLAFISLGAGDVRIGDELAVYIPQQRLDNERPDILPAQMVGVVRVIKVTDHSATVRVTGVRNTGFRNGLPARLVRRAP